MKIITLICFFLISVCCFSQTTIINFKAIKKYQPTQWIDADTSLEISTKFAVPLELPVVLGKSGNHKATLEYSFDSGKKVTITYRGNGDNGSKKASGNKYIFENSSDKNVMPGTYVLADHINLRVNNGDEKAGTTVILLPLSVNNSYGLTRCSSGGLVKFWFNSDTKMNSVIWSWGGGSITSTLIAGPSPFIYGSTASSSSYNGPYTVTVRYSNGTTLVKTLSSLFETILPSPVISISAITNPACPGNNITLTASGANSYLWSGPSIIGSNNTSTITVNVPSSGVDIYTVTGSSTNGCAGTASQQVRRKGLTPAWATFFGGTECDQVKGVVTDANGFIYVAGRTDGVSKKLPKTIGTVIKSTGVMGATTYGPASCLSDIFVSKVSSDGKNVIWTHYIGGNDSEGVIDFTYDNGFVYVVGGTISSDFPVTTGPAYKGNGDGHCTKINANTGDVAWSTYIGSPSQENVEGIAVFGNYVFCSGTINGPGLINATNTHFGFDDIYTAKIDINTGAVLSSLYFGGETCYDCCFGMDHDANGNPIVIGFSNGPINTSFLTPGLEQTNGFASNITHGSFDALCMRYDQNLNLQKWTKIGGTDTEDFEGVRVVGNDIYAVGWSLSNTSNPADYNGAAFKRVGSTVYGTGSRDVFMAKLNLSDLAVNMTRFYGGSGHDGAGDVEFENGSIYVGATTESNNVFASNPATPYYRDYNGQTPNASMLVARFNATTFALDWQTHYGNSAPALPGMTDNIAMALDNQGSVLMVGSTSSQDFEWVASPIQDLSKTYTALNLDGVIVKLECNGATVCPTCRTSVAIEDDQQSLSVSSVEESSALRVYPNPFTNYTNLVISGEESNHTIRIINSIGSIIYEKDNVKTGELVNIGHELPNGLYTVHIIGNDKVQTTQIIKAQ